MSVKVKTVYLVHGAFVRDKGDRIARLRPYFERAGYRVEEIDYRFAGLLRVRLCNRGLAYALSKLVRPGSIAVGHSNGCALIHLAAHHGALFRQVAYINPALDRTAPLAAQVAYAHVWHSPSDLAVWVASFLPFHLWGRMGAVGYVGSDSRYINYNKQADPDIASDSHADVFDREQLTSFAPKLLQAIERCASDR